MMRDGYRACPYKNLIMDESGEMTYASAYRKAVAFARFLREECGLGPSSSVVLSAPNILAFPFIMAGIEMCGSRLVQIAPDLRPADFARRMALVRPQLLIMSSDEQCDMAKRSVPGALVLSSRDASVAYPTVRSSFAGIPVDLSGDPEGVDADSEIALFSSGSTGAPKAIVNRASSFALNAFALRASLSIVPEDVLYLPVPFAHVFGIVGMYAALASGATLVTGLKYRPTASLSLIASTRATLYFGVPTMFLRELRENQRGDWDVSSLRAGLVAGAGCPASVIFDYQERYGCRLVQSYGMTETSATLTMPDLSASAEVRSRGNGDPIAHAQMKLDERTGEILCKSDSLMVGVLREDGSYELDVDEDGWFHSGDIGAYDEEAGYSVVGRIKDMILRGGINIFPAEVEAVYRENPAVSECYLVGYPDSELGERSCLCVLLNPGCDESANDLRNYAFGRIEKCKIPDTVLKLGDFPRLANGKIDKIELRSEVAAALRARPANRNETMGEQL